MAIVEDVQEDPPEETSGTDATRNDATVEDDNRYTRKRCVLITGCSSGIGRATAKAFLAEEWLVVASARETDSISDLAEAGCETIELDVTDPEQVRSAVEYTVDTGGAIDCVVNNAGYAQFGATEDITTQSLHRQFDVNLYGPHRLIRAALPHMRAQGDGHIINVSSVMGRLSVPGSGAYSGSKHALEAMSDALRGEVEEFGIDVTVIQPSNVSSGFYRRLEDELPDEDRTPAYEKLYSMYEDVGLISDGGPLATEPSEVAAAIVHASTCSDPPARYPVGPIATYARYARFLPDRLQDVGYRLLQKLV